MREIRFINSHDASIYNKGYEQGRADERDRIVKELEEEKATAKAMYEKRIQLLKEEDSAKKLYEAEQKYTKILKDIASKKSDLQTQIRQNGMSDREIALDELNQELASSLEGITNTDEEDFFKT